MKTSDKFIKSVTYICATCLKRHDFALDAIKCFDSTETTTLKVGDVVEAGYGFGWFDGDKDWVINPDVNQSKHGFGKDCSMGFYNVITHIDTDLNNSHRLRIHLFTRAMSSNSSYKSCYTYLSDKSLKLIEAPKKIIDESKAFIGLKAEHYKY